MKKISKKVIVTAAVLLVVAVIITASVLSGKSGGVVFADSSGKEIATVKYNGKEKKINPADEGYYDYISIALEEAIAFYYEKNKGVTQNAADYFFENVSVVKTCFESSHFEKIKKSFASSDLEEDTPYAAVMVDSKGKVLAACGYREDGSTVYSLYKTYAGSSIKPLSVYAPAIDRGVVNWSSPVKDAPIKKVKTETEGERDWPSNASGTYTYEDMLVCDAVYKSINTVAVRVLQQTNIRRSMKFLNDKLGMSLASENKILLTESEEEIYGNIALGYLVDGVSPLEMAGYYQIFMNGGTYAEPHAVYSVTDKQGNMLRKTTESVRVISAGTATVMTKLLQGVVKSGGTGKDADIPGVSVAGKSGTSDNYYDNWFVGFNTQFVCAVWHGYNDEQINSAPALFSGIFRQFPKTDADFSISENVVSALYCKKSGGIRGEKCRDTAIGYYLRRNMPSGCTECH